PPMVVQELNPGSHWRGVEHIQALVAGGLTRMGDGVRQPELAEATPTSENGLWQINPDGTMAVTWKLKDGVQWHDGTPFTSEDLAFTMQVALDKEVPILSDFAIYSHISGFDAPDPRTITVRWKDPFIDADSVFGASLVTSEEDPALPIAKHILQRSYP